MMVMVIDGRRIKTRVSNLVLNGMTEDSVNELTKTEFQKKCS
jgi:hypothetical protein